MMITDKDIKHCMQTVDRADSTEICTTCRFNWESGANNDREKESACYTCWTRVTDAMDVI